MPSSFAHAAVALALAPAFWRPGAPRRTWVLGALAAAAPDLDLVLFAQGVEPADPLFHRGLTHSLAFAALLAAALALAIPHSASFSRARAALYLFLATASHGLLDMCTDGGSGIALLFPFTSARYFFPFRPIAVSPLGVRAFLGARGLAVLRSELAWVCAPAAAFAASAVLFRRRQCRSQAD